MIKIILAEDHPIVCNGIKLLLESQEHFCVIGEANNGKETIELLENKLIPDVLITDIGMKEMDGKELTEYINIHYPNIKIIVLSMVGSTQLVSTCFEKGANGYLLKKVDYEELLFAVKHVAKGGKYLCDELSMEFIESVQQNSSAFSNYDNNTHLTEDICLSDRELEVLELISDGLTNTEIADKLFLSKRTVEGHRQNLINKTNVRNSAALIKYAFKNGLIC
ncbi:response regulator [Pedobacter montanisoli]|uniref:Response regulator transcription factor n=1 Tax=Pedobacter montanisoli TaxID=2923277 RepID=A0ABS9ZYP4_9SPHI|nr:response regulator transcription factor [Pedobacter montanisoli]MCJ0743414.1 response regulator transcription factor [Pedobacter montanisoli]